MKPILFNTKMVRAILDGKKTATRRVIKPQPINGVMTQAGFLKAIPEHVDWGGEIVKPRYQAGDILYVRETFVKADDGYHYRADATPDSEQLRKDYGYKYRPSIHMPREAARIFLRITDVRVERLQDITEEQAIAEGVRIGLGGEPFFSCKDAFVRLWDSTLPKNPNKFKCPENSWTTNPFVWVIEFERISKEDAYNA